MGIEKIIVFYTIYLCVLEIPIFVLAIYSYTIGTDTIPDTHNDNGTDTIPDTHNGNGTDTIIDTHNGNSTDTIHDTHNGTDPKYAPIIIEWILYGYCFLSRFSYLVVAVMLKVELFVLICVNLIIVPNCFLVTGQFIISGYNGAKIALVVFQFIWQVVLIVSVVCKSKSVCKAINKRMKFANKTRNVTPKTIWFIEMPRVSHLLDCDLTECIERGSAKYELINALVNNTWQYGDQCGRDATNLTHSQIHVDYVIEIENGNLLQQINEPKTSEIDREVKDLMKTIQTVKELKSYIGRNDDEHNSEIMNIIPNSDSDEVYLFHGTSVDNIRPIIENGFDISKCVRQPYGHGIYLAESSQKADQYTDNPSNRRGKDLAMLIVRTRLGKIARHHTGAHNNNGGIDTIIAGHNARFREFVVTDTKNIYPEFLVIYDRL